MTYLRAERDDMTLACPACDMGQRWWVREDRTARCRECDHECHREALVERPSERGCNLTEADKQRFAGDSEHRYDMSREEGIRYGKLGGRRAKGIPTGPLSDD